MPRKRRRMTARIVPLGSDEAGDARVEGTPAERVALVTELSERAWRLTGRPVPEYTRRDMPVRLSSLADQR